jgi:hypothetical protein
MRRRAVPSRPRSLGGGGDRGENRVDRSLRLRDHRHVRGGDLADRGARPLRHTALDVGRDSGPPCPRRSNSAAACLPAQTQTVPSGLDLLRRPRRKHGGQQWRDLAVGPLRQTERVQQRRPMQWVVSVGTDPPRPRSATAATTERKRVRCCRPGRAPAPRCASPPLPARCPTRPAHLGELGPGQ